LAILELHKNRERKLELAYSSGKECTK